MSHCFPTHRVVTALWAPDRRAATVGILLLVTLTAFERMGVTTAMPRLVGELHGTRLYAWPFLSFLVAAVIATVLAGQLCDRYGPARVVLAGPLLFLAGLLLAGLAPTMPVLLAGRVLQGMGAGTQTVVSTVLIGLVYPERDRPAAFGAVSAAWVLPALIGPTVSGIVTERFGWRLVFLGLVPLVLLAVLSLIPVLRRLPRHDGTAVHSRLPAALGAAAGVAALSWSAQHPSAPMAVLGLAAVAVLLPAQRVLLPAGTLRARPGLPVTILARGLLSGAYFACVAYVPLTLAVAHGFDPVLAGIPLTVGSLGWAGAAFWQGRHRDLPRPTLLRMGFVLVAIGVATLALAAPPWSTPWMALPALAIAGAGMGLGVSSVSVLTLAASTPADRGFNSAAMWLADQLGAAMLIGLGGTLIAALGSADQPSPAVVTLNLLMAGIAVLGAVLTGARAVGGKHQT